jgi:Protein of unknown function (DUF2934)
MATAKAGGSKGYGETMGSKPPVNESKQEHAIREKAYLLWEKAGRPHGRDVEFWHKAKKEVLGQ